MAAALSIAALAPGSRYFFPTGELLWFKVILTLAGLWGVRFLCSFISRAKGTLAAKAVGGALTAASFLLMSHHVAFFGLVLLVFFRWLGLAVLAAMLAWLALVLRVGWPRPRAALVSFTWVPLAGMLGLWWNFLMIGACGFDQSQAQNGIRPIITVEQLKQNSRDIGEAHPYAIAYDSLSDTLIASFKDDWGAIFPRLDDRRHNFLLACSTAENDPRPRTLFLGPSQIPENLALRPAEQRGWVNVLDMKQRTFHVASFSYGDDEITLTGFADLPVEPNAIFDDPERGRLLVVGIQMQLLELDPDTLDVRSTTDLFPHMDPRGETINVFSRVFDSELSIISSLFLPSRDELYLGTLGHFVHGLTLPDMHHQQAPAFLLTIGLGWDGGREIFAAMPMQREVLVWDADTLQVKERIPARVPVRALAPVPGTRLIAAGSYSQNRTLLIDRDTGEVIAEFRPGRLQRDALYIPGEPRVILATGLGLFEINAGQALGLTGGDFGAVTQRP